MPPKGRSAKDFKNLELVQHIRQIPDTYVGSTERIPRQEWIYSFEEKRMVLVELDLPEAVKRVTLEIISNAGDHAYFSRTKGFDPGTIDFSWDDDGYLTVKNAGSAFPVEPHEKTTKDKLYLLPTDVFSVPLTGTNFNEETDREGCGRNGYGSKLTNIFSDHFIVEIGDSGRLDDNGKKISGQEYIGEWKDQMRQIVTAVSSPGFEPNPKKDAEGADSWIRIKKDEYTGPAYVQISWKLAFNAMNIKDRQTYTELELGLFVRYMIEFSATCAVPITINGEPYDFRSIRKLAELYYPVTITQNAVVQFCASKERPFPKKWASLKTDQQREEFIVESGFIPESQIVLLDTPDDAQTFAYVNGLVSSEGGVHIDKIQKELFGPIVKELNEKHKGSIRLTAKDVKPHVTMFVICRVLNAKYNSQSKTKLESPTPNISFKPSVIKEVMSDDWRLVERLKNTIGAKDIKGLSKSDGKKVGLVKVKGLTDANRAGRGDSKKCTLYLVEGISAASYPRYRIQDLEGTKDYNGFYTLQGKVMNVQTHDTTQIAAYKEFINLKKALGLRNEYTYKTEAEFSSLRYGRAVITTDADSDGMHIVGLLLNMLFVFWPYLFERGFIHQLVTPVVRVFVKKGEVLRFYDERSFNKWFAEHGKSVSSTNVSYLKGLGSSTPADVKDDVPTAPILNITIDEKGKELINLAFDKLKSHERKEWIQRWRETRDSVPPFIPKALTGIRPVSEVMGVHFPPYMIDNLVRSIPCFYDGLKKSQRQVLYAALEKYNYGKKYENSRREGDKMIGFGAGVIDVSKYHHGDQSLYDTVFKMMRDYPGSNNMSPLKPMSMTGTRTEGGKDAPKSRYAKLFCPWWMQYVFNQEMVKLVPRREVDGELGEPNWLPCDIPLGIINGCQGVATGWSTYLPMHHPIAVVDWILSRLSNKKRIEPLAPYFHGFKGKVEYRMKIPKIVDKKGARGADSEAMAAAGAADSTADLEDDSSIDLENPDVVDEDKIPLFTKGRGIVLKGHYKIVKEYDKINRCDVAIYEIPLTIPTKKYVEFVEQLVADGKADDHRDLSGPENVHIEIFKLESRLATPEGLKLERGLPLSNMVMLDVDGIPNKYSSVESILAKYIIEMVNMYDIYKKFIIDRDGQTLASLNMELAIILSYLEGKLVIDKKTDEEIDRQLKELQLSKEIFDKINLRQLSKTRVDTLKKKIADITASIEAFSKKTPETLWSERLKAFKTEFNRRKFYPKPYDDVIQIEDSTNMIIDGEYTFKKASITYY